MTGDDICHLSVARLGELYRKRKLSPLEVVDAHLTRISRLNPTLNAYVLVTAETAIEAAREAEHRFASGASDELPPLYGIPFSVKDTLQTAGVTTTFGSPLFRDVVPREDAAVVAAVKRAGGILLGKTNTPALGWMAVTQNKLFKPTLNPWNPALTPGGSSGGAAVAASAALAPVNIGTDGGGSLRVPASFTGTVGFKPTHGLVPNYPTGNNWSLQHIGPIARTVEDAAFALDAMVVADHRDPYSWAPALKSLSFAGAIRRSPAPMKILFCPDPGYAESIDPEVVAVCRKAMPAFRELGHAVTEHTLDWTSPMEIWQTLFVAGVANRLGDLARESPELIEDTLLGFVAQGQRLAPDAYYRAWLARNDWWQQVCATFQDYDLVITPTVACAPFAIGKETAGTIAGKAVSFYGWTPFSAPFNLSGQPAISLPAGFNRDGLPIGLQIVGRRFDDELVLAVASSFEKIRPWPTRAPDRFV